MPLRYLFADMNSYFASVEQQYRPELRHRPVGVAPVLAETTCCIAASYEAKRFGVKTGTMVREARRLCPGIQIVEARPPLYVEVHQRIVKAVDSCLPVTAVKSIDEMAARLPLAAQQPEEAMALAKQVKRAIRRAVGEYLRCSIGLAPNQLLAKVAADMQKPDGLTVLKPEELPASLHSLALGDLPGVGPRMEQRLRQAKISTVQQLCEATPAELSRVWGSRLVGTNWWHLLRGEDVSGPPTRRQSLGHSHVLPPDLRNDAGAKAVLMRLIHKAAARLRHEAHWAGSLQLAISFIGHSGWHAQERFPPCQDTLTIIQAFLRLWDRRPQGMPLKVGIVLGDLAQNQDVSRPLFAEQRELVSLSQAMDRLNRRFGACTVYFAGMHEAHNAAPMRIAFTHIPDPQWES